MVLMSRSIRSYSVGALGPTMTVVHCQGLKQCDPIPRQCAEGRTMAAESECNIPEDRYYWIDKHVWARPVGDLVEVGVTDPAQGLAGKMLVCRIKRVGRELKRGASAATLESGKWVGGVSTPLSGVIAEVNEGPEKDPEELNRDPYGAWLFRMTPTHWAEDVKELVTGASGVQEYRARIAQEGIQCGH